MALLVIIALLFTHRTLHDVAASPLLYDVNCVSDDTNIDIMNHSIFTAQEELDLLQNHADQNEAMRWKRAVDDNSAANTAQANLPNSGTNLNPQVPQINPQATQNNPPTTQINSSPNQINPAQPQVNPSPIQNNPTPTQINPSPTQINSSPNQINPAQPQINPTPTQINPSPPQINPGQPQINPTPTQINPTPTQINPTPTQINPTPTQINPTQTQINSQQYQPSVTPFTAAHAGLDFADQLAILSMRLNRRLNARLDRIQGGVNTLVDNKLIQGVPLSREKRQLPNLSSFLTPNTQASQTGTTGGGQAPATILGFPNFLNLPDLGLGGLINNISKGLNTIEENVGNLIGAHLKGVNDVVSTALDAGGQIANSSVKLALDIPRVPLSLLQNGN